VADEVGALMAREDFQEITLRTVMKRITFPSVFDYVQFQLVATPPWHYPDPIGRAEMVRSARVIPTSFWSAIAPTPLH
jgi:hypothetical protein